jgi:hypothetical protein
MEADCTYPSMPQELRTTRRHRCGRVQLPVPDCSSLVIEYRAADSVRPGHPEDWEFTCPRCGIEFTVAQGELIFHSGPKQWLSSSIHAA